MKKLFLFLFCISLIGLHGFAQNRSFTLSHNLGPVKPWMMGSAQRPETCDTSTNLCFDDELVVYTASCILNTSGGYVCGHNCYGDISKADIFHLSSGSVKGLLLYFAVGKAANSTDQFNVRIWDNDGIFQDGGTDAPGTILGSQTVEYNTVKNDVINGVLTYVEFSSPINIPADGVFYAGIDFTYQNGDTVSLTGTIDRTASGLSCEDLNTSVEQWSDGSWHAMPDADSWGLAMSQMILPITCSQSCNITIDPPAATICKTQSVNLTASGGTVYTWSPSAGLNGTTGATVSASPASATTYTVTSDDCSATVLVTVKNSPTAWIHSSSCDNGVVKLTRRGSPGTGVSFQWYEGSNAISGATNSTYLANQSGTYRVGVTINASGCADISAAHHVMIDCKIAADDVILFNADAFPNPFSNTVTINISSVSSDLATVKVMDFSGRIVREFKNVDPTAPFVINDELAPGVYFVRVNQGSNEKMIKVVKD